MFRIDRAGPLIVAPDRLQTSLIGLYIHVLIRFSLVMRGAVVVILRERCGEIPCISTAGRVSHVKVHAQFYLIQQYQVDARSFYLQSFLLS